MALRFCHMLIKDGLNITIRPLFGILNTYNTRCMNSQITAKGFTGVFF